MNITGWGRYPHVDADVDTLRPLTTSRTAADLLHGQPLIAHGLGRGYGDCALATRVLHTTRYNRLRSFDPDTGLLLVEAGASLGDIVDSCLPMGWFLGVTPGTRFVTVGGAIAADVHGKNHHVAGCFSQFVSSFSLLVPAPDSSSHARVVECSPTSNAELYHATCGGMGLTGVILTATLQLVPVSSSFMTTRTCKAKNLREIFDLFEEYDSSTYSVAWIDCLARGNSLGRSLLMLGEHQQHGPLRKLAPPRLSIPMDMPSFTLCTSAIKVFNELYYQRIRSRQVDGLQHLSGFFYPLDSVDNWNRMYGRKGFIQYQFVLPPESAYQGLHRVLETIARAGQGSFLAVLKLLGAANDNMLSFPMPGYTLALDFKITDTVFELLNELDAMVVDHGGRFYLAKDSRMSRETFARGYPRLEEFIQLRKRSGMNAVFNSLQSRRLEL